MDVQKEIMGVKRKPDIIDSIEKKRLQWYGHVKKDARGENTKINYGMDTTGEKEKRTTRNLEPDQWRNREEWRLVSGRRRQLL